MLKERVGWEHNTIKFFEVGMELKTRECLQDISFWVKWNISSSTSDQSLIAAYMKYHEMKIIASVISLRSFSQKWNFISVDKCHVNTFLERIHLEDGYLYFVWFVIFLNVMALQITPEKKARLIKGSFYR